MKPIQSLLAVGLVLMVATTTPASVYYKDKVRMIETAEIITVFEITGVETASVKGEYWTYRQKASAKVEKVMKGKVSGSVFLYGDMNFICAQCHFEPGRYLVFLCRDGDLLTGNNMQLSIRKITRDSEEKIEWFDDRNIFEKKEALLSDVLSEIAVELAFPNIFRMRTEPTTECGQGLLVPGLLQISGGVVPGMCVVGFAKGVT